MVENLLNKFKDSGNVAIFVAFAISLYLRFSNFLHKPSLYIDEANVACNLAERGFLGFWSKLDYEQYAPPIFMMWTKFNALLFGYREIALRLIPFLSAIFCLFGLYKLSNKLTIAKPLIAVVILLFGVNYWCILQSYSLKQYVPDLAMALGLILVALRKDYTRFYTRKALIQWSIAGAILVWSSMPIVYTMAAMGAYFAWQAYRAGEFWKWLRYFSIPVGIWVVNFGIYFVAILNVDAKTDYLQQYHRIYFLTAELWTKAGWSWNWTIIKGLLAGFVGESLWTMGVFVAFYAVGLVALARKHTAIFFLLVLPFALALFSSMLGYYSLITRLVIFTVPIQSVVMAYGMQKVYDQRFGGFKLLVLTGAVVLVYHLNAWTFLWNGNKIVLEDTRSSLAYVQQNRLEGEPFLVNHEGTPVAKFYINYAARHEEKFGNCQGYISLSYPIDWKQKTIETIQKNPDKAVWLMLGHIENYQADQLVQQLASHPDVAILHQEIVWRSRAVKLQKK